MVSFFKDGVDKTYNLPGDLETKLIYILPTLPKLPFMYTFSLDPFFYDNIFCNVLRCEQKQTSCFYNLISLLIHCCDHFEYKCFFKGYKSTDKCTLSYLLGILNIT